MEYVKAWDLKVGDKIHVNNVGQVIREIATGQEQLAFLLDGEFIYTRLFDGEVLLLARASDNATT